MRDMMTWQAFEKEDGTPDADKGSVLTGYPVLGGEPVVHTLTRRETATLLGALTLTLDYLGQQVRRDAEQAFKGGDARV